MLQLFWYHQKIITDKKGCTHKSIRKNEYVGTEDNFDDEDKEDKSSEVEIKVNNYVVTLLLYASVMLMERRI